MECFVCLAFIYVASDNILSDFIHVHVTMQTFSLCVWEDQLLNQCESLLYPNTAVYDSKEKMLLPV